MGDQKRFNIRFLIVCLVGVFAAFVIGNAMPTVFKGLIDPIIVGTAVCFCFGVVFNNRHLLKRLLYRKIITGLFAGCVLEFGFHLFFPGFLTKLAMTLLLGIIIAFYRLNKMWSGLSDYKAATSLVSNHSGFDNDSQRDEEDSLSGRIRKGWQTWHHC